MSNDTFPFAVVCRDDDNGEHIKFIRAVNAREAIRQALFAMRPGVPVDEEAISLAVMGDIDEIGAVHRVPDVI